MQGQGDEWTEGLLSTKLVRQIPGKHDADGANTQQQGQERAAFKWI